MGAAVPIEINVGGKIEDSDILGFTVERDMGQPDMAAIVLSNQQANYTTRATVGQAVEIKVGDESTSIYKGELVGLEGMYKGGEKSRLTIRAMNKLHRLLRTRKSITYTDKSDQQILSQVAGNHGLSIEWKHEKSITYKHVYQHNQTDLEFLRMRAGRMGAHVWCVDSKLYVKEPQLDQSPTETLSIGDANKEAAVRMFAPRLSSAGVLKKVTVKGWNPETKELIVGEAQAQNSKLGAQNAATAASSFGSLETFTTDHPIWSKDEADALAKARLRDQSLSFMTGELEMIGNPKFDLGQIVGIQSSNEDNKSDDLFNGNYYIMGITHRYSASKTKDGGYVTILRLARDAQKPAG